MLALRRAGSIMQLLGQMSAERIGINVTDLNCLNIVALTGSMTAGDLARATGLTTASITGVLDRLEEGGFVRRERDPHDRRRVIVKLNAGPGLREVGPHLRAGAQGVAGHRGRLLRRRAAAAAGIPAAGWRRSCGSSWPGCGGKMRGAGTQENFFFVSAVLGYAGGCRRVGTRRAAFPPRAPAGP